MLINDGNEFPISFKNIYPKELELKVKHHGIKASFLGLEIKIEDTDYKRDKFTFFIVQMLHLPSKSAISYWFIFSELLRTTRCMQDARYLEHQFLFLRVMAKDEKKALLDKQLKKKSTLSNCFSKNWQNS